MWVAAKGLRYGRPKIRHRQDGGFQAWDGVFFNAGDVCDALDTCAARDASLGSMV